MTSLPKESRLPKSVLFVAAVCVAGLAVLAYLWYAPPAGGVQLPVYRAPFHGDTVLVFDTDFSPDYWTNNSTEINYLTTPLCYPVADPNQGCPPGVGYILTATCPDTPAGCANVTPGTTFRYSITLIDEGNHTHTIQSFLVQEPFRLLGVSPTLPALLSRGLPGTNFTLEVQAPTVPGAYDLAGTVNCV